MVSSSSPPFNVAIALHKLTHVGVNSLSKDGSASGIVIDVMDDQDVDDSSTVTLHFSVSSSSTLHGTAGVVALVFMTTSPSTNRAHFLGLIVVLLLTSSTVFSSILP